MFAYTGQVAKSVPKEGKERGEREGKGKGVRKRGGKGGKGVRKERGKEKGMILEMNDTVLPSRFNNHRREKERPS